MEVIKNLCPEWKWSVKCPYDLEIHKLTRVDGETVEMGNLLEKFEAAQTKVADYSLEIRHLGGGTYGLLPVTDLMSGAQSLLAKVEDNLDENNAPPTWADNTDTVLLDGEKYYVLNAKNAENGAAAEYKGVWLENAYADSVTVTKTADGFDTLIKWYYIADVSADYTLAPAYRAAYGAEYGTSLSSIFNRAWINDLPTHRLFSEIVVEGSVIAIQKRIVVNKGASPAEDTLWETGKPYPLSEGCTVTYRLEFTNNGKTENILTGDDFYDILPEVGLSDGVRTFDWSDANVKISYATSADNPDSPVTAEFNGATNAADFGGEEYCIALQNESADCQSYVISWDSGFKVRFPKDVDGGAYIYVELTFPSGAQWSTYKNEKNNSILSNTLVKGGIEASVTHMLGNRGMAMLRKGVYETGYYVTANNVSSSNPEFKQTYQYFRGADRMHYVKTDADEEMIKNTVTYFTVLYNSSETDKLYLSPIYDRLPKGFEFYAMVQTPDISDNSAGFSGSSVLWSPWNGGRSAGSVGLTYGDSEPLAKPKSGTPENDSLIKWYANYGDTNIVKVREPYNDQVLIFDITLDEAHKDALGYYLNPGESVQFGYMCFTGDAADVEAENICAMEYLDFAAAGVDVDSETDIEVSDYNGFIISNTGDAELLDSERAVRMGFEENPLNPASVRKWLASRVSLTEGEIIPGIEKTVTAETANVNLDNASADHNVLWRIKTTNSGTNAMRDYTVSDTIQTPLSFMGDVCYNIYSNTANITSIESDGRREVAIAGNQSGDKLFTITSVSDEGVAVKTCGADTAETDTQIPYNTETELTVAARFFNSSAAGASYYSAQVFVSFAKTDGGVMMNIRFSDPTFSIPAGGYSELTLNSIVPKNTDQTGEFKNDAVVLPSQTFTEKDAYGEGITTENGQLAGVTSSATVNLYKGILTEAYKELSVTERGTSSTGASNSPNNTVYLDDKTVPLTYTMYVSGTADDSAGDNMQSLVLIDALPQTGDTNPVNSGISRKSKFKVDFAQNPNVKVSFVTEAGERTLVNDEQHTAYTVYYSADNSGFTGADWEGGAGVSGRWTAASAAQDFSAYRSIRVVINEPLPTGTTAKVSYDAEISAASVGDDEALPSETAWSNFGYSYYYKGTMWLLSSTKNVGVGIRGIPSVAKALVNSSGTPVKAAAKKTYSFVVYKDDDVVFDAYDAAAVGNALAGRDFTYVSLPVETGMSLSETITLQNMPKYTYGDSGFTALADSLWTWENGVRYSVVEITPDGDEYTYGYTNRTANTERVYTFTYLETENHAVTAYNIRHNWSITITKTDDSSPGKRLPGAVFGLYSVSANPNIAELLADFGLSENTVTEFEQDGVTYYLSQIAFSGPDGTTVWSGLDCDRYAVRELKAPAGYYPSDEIYWFNYEDAAQNGYSLNQQIINTLGLELPETGRNGEMIYIISGLLLLAAAVCGYITKRRREA